MFNKTVYTLSFILIFFMMVSSISASENLTDLNLASDADASIYQESSGLELNQDILESDISKNNDIVSDSDSNLDFTSDINEGIGNVTINFEGSSSDENVNEWVWDFGDGTTGSGQNINHFYSNFGSYNVSLTTKDSDGLILGNITKNYYINVYLDIDNVFKNPNFVYPITEKFNSAARSTIPDDWILYTGSGPDVNWMASPRSFSWATKYDDRHYNTAILLGNKASVMGERWHANEEIGFGQYIYFTNLKTIYFQAYMEGTKDYIPLLTACFGDYRVNFTCTSVKDSGYVYSFDVSNITGIQFFKIFFYGLYDSEGNLAPDELSGVTIAFSRFGGTYLPNTTTFDYIINEIDGDNFNINFGGNFLSSTITNVLWDFGDETTSTELNPTHSVKYGDVVSLTIFDSNKTSYTYSRIIGTDLPKIGDTFYASLQDAINGAEEGAIIDLHSDLIGNLQVNKSVTLNFNGNTIVSSVSPVIQVLDGAKVTIKNITFEDSNVISTDDESSLTITESNIKNANIILNNGNIELTGNEFNNSFITVADANVVITNNNVANGGIKVNGGKSKINNNVLSGNDVAIIQTGGETNITSNKITNNNIGVNVTGGTSNINFNVIYGNNKVAIAYVGSVDASNNWFGVVQPIFTTISSDEYVDIYAPEAESQPTWLVLTLSSDETTLCSAQKYTINVDLTLNSKGENTSALGVLPEITLPVSTELGETDEVNIENSQGEFTLNTGILIADEALFIIKGEGYVLDADVFNINDIIAELEKQLEEAQANATKLAGELDDAKSNATKLAGELDDAKSNATKLAEELNNSNIKVANLTTQLNDAKSNATKLAGELDDVKSNATKLAEELNNSNIKVANLTTQLSDAQAKLSSTDSKPSTSTNNVVSTKKATKITAPKKTFKVKTKSKKVKITLKSGKTAIKGKKITIKVNGKTFSAKTNNKGVATINVKLTKKGTFTYTVKFAGDNAFKAISKKGKLIIK